MNIQTHINEIRRRIRDDELMLPMLPDVAINVIDAAGKSDLSASVLANIIQRDVAMTAKIIKVCNSPLLQGPVKVSNLQTAIGRLGVLFIKNLVLGMAVEQAFKSKNAKINAKFQEMWKQSNEIAALSHTIATYYTNLRSEQAALAGLIHNIGALPILTYINSNSELINDEQLLKDFLDIAQAPLGTMILKHWNFADDLLEVPLLYQNYEPRVLDEPDYVDVVRIAYLFSHAANTNQLKIPEKSSIDSFVRLNFSVEFEPYSDPEFIDNLEKSRQLFGS